MRATCFCTTFSILEIALVKNPLPALPLIIANSQNKILSWSTLFFHATKEAWLAVRAGQGRAIKLSPFMRLEETLAILFGGLSLDSEFSMYWVINWMNWVTKNCVGFFSNSCFGVLKLKVNKKVSTNFCNVRIQNKNKHTICAPLKPTACIFQTHLLEVKNVYLWSFFLKILFYVKLVFKKESLELFFASFQRLILVWLQSFF